MIIILSEKHTTTFKYSLLFAILNYSEIYNSQWITQLYKIFKMYDMFNNLITCNYYRQL